MVNMRAIWMFLLFQRSCFALKPPPPLNVVPITAGNSSVLGNLNNTIGLQGALNKNYRSTDGAITVFVDACMQDDGARDCTAACQNHTQMFRNLTTLHNCIVFSDISLHRSNNSLTTEASQLAEELNIEPGNNGSWIFNATQSCLLDSCNSNTDCAGNFSNTRNDTYISLCGAIPHPTIPDVGGIGVFISYVMQMGLALLAFALTIPWLSIIKRVRTSFVYVFRASSLQNKSSKPKQSLSNRKSIKALGKAIEDFQKAQCFFMLATNIASLIAEKSGGLDPISLQQLYNTYVLIKVVAIGGYLPITFTLLNLHMIKKLSWYLLTLSTVTIAVAITTLKSGSTTFAPTPEDFSQIEDQAALPGPISCGNQNLVPWCYYPRQDGNYFGFNSSSSGSGANNILVICLITLVVIVVDHFCRSDDHHQRSLNGRILQKLGIAASEPLFPHAGKVLRLGTVVFHFIFFWLYIYCFYIFGVDLDWFRTSKLYDPSWTFGQIVAIFVWAPTLCDYVWDQIRMSWPLPFPPPTSEFFYSRTNQSFCSRDETNLDDVVVGGEREDSDKDSDDPVEEGNETESSHGLTMMGSRSLT